MHPVQKRTTLFILWPENRNIKHWFLFIYNLTLQYFLLLKISIFKNKNISVFETPVTKFWVKLFQIYCCCWWWCKNSFYSCVVEAYFSRAQNYPSRNKFGAWKNMLIINSISVKAFSTFYGPIIFADDIS